MPDTKNSIAPKIIREFGAEHPINKVIESVMNLLSSYGFEIKSGPEIETEEFNFDMLNIKKSHPARQMHDTFYVNNKSHGIEQHKVIKPKDKGRLGLLWLFLASCR